VKRKRYTRKFQRMAVARMETCENVGELARELGVRPRCLYKWRRKLAQRTPLTEEAGGLGAGDREGPVSFGRNRESRRREAAGRRNWPEAVPKKMRGGKRLLTELSARLAVVQTFRPRKARFPSGRFGSRSQFIGTNDEECPRHTSPKCSY
jgi:transposase-like protein